MQQPLTDIFHMLFLTVWPNLKCPEYHFEDENMLELVELHRMCLRRNLKRLIVKCFFLMIMKKKASLFY